MNKTKPVNIFFRIFCALFFYFFRWWSSPSPLSSSHLNVVRTLKAGMSFYTLIKKKSLAKWPLQQTVTSSTLFGVRAMLSACCAQSHCLKLVKHPSKTNTRDVCEMNILFGCGSNMLILNSSCTVGACWLGFYCLSPLLENSEHWNESLKLCWMFTYISVREDDFCTCHNRFSHFKWLVMTLNIQHKNCQEKFVCHSALLAN